MYRISMSDIGQAKYIDLFCEYKCWRGRKKRNILKRPSRARWGSAAPAPRHPANLQRTSEDCKRTLSGQSEEPKRTPNRAQQTPTDPKRNPREFPQNLLNIPHQTNPRVASRQRLDWNTTFNENLELFWKARYIVLQSQNNSRPFGPFATSAIRATLSAVGFLESLASSERWTPGPWAAADFVWQQQAKFNPNPMLKPAGGHPSGLFGALWIFATTNKRWGIVHEIIEISDGSRNVHLKRTRGLGKPYREPTGGRRFV